jgi:SAM-dependent methyltransferase
VSHPEQLAFLESVRAIFPAAFEGRRVLEIGSLDINGSIRSLFRGCDYIGIDVAAGRGVDVVCQGQDYDAPDASFDTVVSCEAMEHNPYWKATLANMFRLCKPGGLVVMTCASTGRPEHGTTRTTPADSPLTVALGWDYYHNLSEREIRNGVRLHDACATFLFCRNLAVFDLYFVGLRKGVAVPPGVRRKLAILRLSYLCRNLRIMPSRLKRRLLIAIVGEERYRSGPVRPW